MRGMVALTPLSRKARVKERQCRRRAKTGTLTLVYAARDTEHNDAVALADVLRRGLPRTAYASSRSPRPSAPTT
jgi:hypothetical protein